MSLLSDAGLITLFTTCKPFDGEFGRMQTNAIRSWRSLGLPVLIIGDEAGCEGVAKAFGCVHIRQVECNEHGIPYISDLFAQAIEACSTRYMAYVNADIILDSRSLHAIEAFVAKVPSDQNFLYVGRRRNVPLQEDLFNDPLTWQTRLEELDDAFGTWDETYAIDFFLFNTDWLQKLPPLTVGRAGWDNWMLLEAVQQKAWVVDASHDLRLYHPLHGYSRDAGGFAAVTTGTHAEQNRQYLRSENGTISACATHLQRNGNIVQLSEVPPHFDRQFEVDIPKRFEADIITISSRGGEDLEQTIDDLKTVLWRTKSYVPPLVSAKVLQSDVAKLISELKQILNSEGSLAAAARLQDFLAAELLTKLQSLIAEQRPIYIWGSSAGAERLWTFLSRHKIPVTGLVDGTLGKDEGHETKLGAHMFNVFALQKMMEIIGDLELPPYFMIASIRRAEILEQLQVLGMKIERDYI